jgi:hypothetical protein
VPIRGRILYILVCEAGPYCKVAGVSCHPMVENVVVQITELWNKISIFRSDQSICLVLRCASMCSSVLTVKELLREI